MTSIEIVESNTKCNIKVSIRQNPSGCHMALKSPQLIMSIELITDHFEYALKNQNMGWTIVSVANPRQLPYLRNHTIVSIENV